jgi:hypothetical protein
MKNRLLATLLLFTAVPFFANNATIQKPNKAELLSYLQKAKTHIQNILQNTSEDAQILEEEYGSQLYKETTNIWHELYAVIPAEIKLTEVDCFFDFTSQELEKLSQQNEDEIFINLMNSCIPVGPSLCNELQTNQKQLIKSIFSKYGKDASKPSEEILDEFFGTEENWEIGMMIDMARFINTLLPKIDAKIAELEAQL